MIKIRLIVVINLKNGKLGAQSYLLYLSKNSVTFCSKKPLQAIHRFGKLLSAYGTGNADTSLAGEPEWVSGNDHDFFLFNQIQGKLPGLVGDAGDVGKHIKTACGAVNPDPGHGLKPGTD
jgi:hypothetical protein